MFNTILIVCTMFAFSFLIKENDGPFNILAKLRIFLLQNKYVGVFFYKLLSCYFCVGFYGGIATYLLYETTWKINLLIMWGLTGSTVSLIFDGLLNKLQNNSQ